MFVAEEGYEFVSADYSNLEARVLAYVTEDEALIRLFEEGINLHDHNTEVLFHIEKGDPKWKVARAAAKIFMFGGISYGGGDREIYEKVTMEVPELGLTFAEYKEAKDSFMRAHPAYAKWAERVKRIGRETRTSTTFMGAKRFLTSNNIHDVEKQSLNNPIQGGAAHIINRAMVHIDDEIRERSLPMLLVLQVHDQLVYEVKEGLREDAIALLRREMEKPVEIGARTVTFPVDVEVGASWGTLHEVAHS